MRYLLLWLHLVAAATSFGQDKDPWIKFTDPKTRLAGYKGAGGTIKIPAKFENYFVADTFHNIIAVREPAGNKYESYYLLKNGARAGTDSLYHLGGYDCESDGMIMYNDVKTGYVGYLNIDGAPVIPAVYNTATSFRNGWAQALINSKKRCWDASDDTTDCEHLIWEGGTGVLINRQNEILAEGIPADFYQHVDWYSVRVNDMPKDTSVYVRVEGKDGKTYYFLHMQKEFQKWFLTEFLPASPADKAKYLFSELMVWNEKESWHGISKEAFLKSFSAVLKNERFQFNADKRLGFAQGEFSDYVMTSPIYRMFYTACGKFDKYRYPLFLAQISYYKKNEFDHSESFEFIRTSDGYRLVEAPTK